MRKKRNQCGKSDSWLIFREEKQTEGHYQRKGGQFLRVEDMNLQIRRVH